MDWHPEVNDERWRCPFCGEMAGEPTREPVICDSRTCRCGAIALGAPPRDFDEIVDDAINVFGPRIRESSKGFDSLLLADLRRAGVEVRDGICAKVPSGLEHRYVWFRAPRPTLPDLGEICEWLKELQECERMGRRYRFRGDAFYEAKREQACMECHAMAAEWEKRADGIAERLSKALGPGGIPAEPEESAGEAVAAAAGMTDPWQDPRGGFDDACFYARHPLWAEFAAEIAEAHRRWKDDPRFLREAPRYRPVNRAWEP
jgi:hypothetical protein